MTAQTNPKQRMTAEEFFDWDGGGHVGKLELVHGVVRAQSYASEGHGRIQGNIARHIGNHLAANRPSRGVVIEGGVIPTFDPKRNVRKPDLSVTCTAHESGARAVRNPTLIVEVLSPTNSDETWESIQACATIGSVAEILVVESEEVKVHVFTKDAKGVWPDPGVVVTGPGTIRLVSLGMELSMADIYRGTDLASAAE